MIFSSVEAAQRHGFKWLEFDRKLGLHLMVRDDRRADGLRVRALAYARASRATTLEALTVSVDWLPFKSAA